MNLTGFSNPLNYAQHIKSYPFFCEKVFVALSRFLSYSNRKSHLLLKMNDKDS